jgi:hypothetical protein
VVPIEKDVFGLQVAMTDVETVTISEGGDDLAEQPNSFFFGERSVVGNVVEQFTSFNVLENEVTTPGQLIGHSKLGGGRTVLLGSPTHHID